MDTDNILPISDLRGLQFLNRQERRIYFSQLRGLPAKLRRLSVIDLMRQIEAKDGEGTLIVDKNKELPTIKQIALFALRAPHEADQKTGFQEKNNRGLLAKRIEKSQKIELTQQEKNIIKERIGMLFVQPDLITEAALLLDLELEKESVQA